MTKIGIVTNLEKDIDLKFTEILIKCIKAYDASIILPADTAGLIHGSQGHFETGNVYEKSDVIICLGGDGTFLNVARNAYKQGIPILGINLGSLGFLTEVEKGDIEKAVQCVLEKKYTIEERMMLEAFVYRDKKIIANDTALNDVVISRGAMSRLLYLKTYINSEFVDVFPGDGLVISSPTGSTAYSLAVGGPIVEPDTEMIIVSPICPHIIYSRSFITTADRVVKVKVNEDYVHEAVVSVDGQTGCSLKGGDVIEVKRAASTVKMIRISDRNFFKILRTKIYDRVKYTTEGKV